MTIVVCVDDAGGMLFNKRRVSSDRAVTAKMLELSAAAPIYMSPYSAKLFPENANIVVLENFPEGIPDGAISFWEQALPADFPVRVRKVILFKWNRRYPSDVRFPVSALLAHGTPLKEEEFAGHSHDRVTREVYVL